MKYVGVILASLVTALILTAIGIFSFLPADEPPPAEAAAATSAGAEPAVSLPIPPTIDTATIETTLAQRDAVYQGQLGDLEQNLQERQTTYQTQIQQASAQVAAAQSRLEELQALETELAAQVAQYDAARRERLGTYQTQLTQLQDQYQARFAELEQALTQTQSQLAEANIQLGR
ncbi:MAG TPA: hypothetical protein PKE64_10900 [Anaerolineae bacterium]|nr:hypothetical protein [Anaerolineae bacterium]HMR64507.1 hypothetical protein [Anaerolineae bacterium]